MSTDHTAGTGPDAPDGDDAVHVLRLRTVHQILAAVPHMLGHQPHDSLVTVMLRARKVVVTARIDFPRPTDVPLVWPALHAAVARSDAEAAILIAYTDAAGDRAIRTCVTTAPLPILDAIRVHDGQYWVLTCPDPHCCPPGQPIDPQPHVAAPLVALTGRAVARDRTALAECLTPAPAPVLDQVTDHLQTLPPQPTDPSAGLTELDHARRSRADGPRQPTPDQAARLLHALADIDVRDACCGWSDGDDAWWLWLDLIPLTPPAHVPVVAALIAVTAYSRGDGTMATIAAEHALTHDPGYPLAHLVLQSAEHAMPPTEVSNILGAGAAAARDRLRRRSVDNAAPNGQP